MDIRYFLEQRLLFIEQLYANAASAFVERKRRIEGEEEPFIPPYSEDPEPPFLEEWLEAEDSLQVLGRLCVSMLAASLHLYFKTWQSQLGRPIDSSMRSTFSKHGWLKGYAHYFKHYFGVSFERCPCNMVLLEEIVLARNRVQHPDAIASNHSHYSSEDLRKLSSPYFIGRHEAELLAADDGRRVLSLLRPSIQVTAEHLSTAIMEVRKFAQWLETFDQ